MSKYIKEDYSLDVVLGRLPDPFLFNDGTRVKTADDWKRRRKEIIDSAVELEFGGMPPIPDRVEVETLTARGAMYCYRIHIYGGTGHFVFPIEIYVPYPGFDRKKKYPILLTGDGCYRFCSDEVIAEAHKRGWLVAKFNRVELAHDIPGDPSRDHGVYQLWPDMHFSAISVWAWGYHRCIDAFEQIPFCDETQVAITGHSRGGKTTMLAGATDERIAYTNPNNSGTHGCGCWRYITIDPLGTPGQKRGEILADFKSTWGYWYGPKMRDYVYKDERIPHDAHFFKALCAPRHFIETNGYADIAGNPRGSYQTYLAAKEVYKFLGAEENIVSHYRDGGHDHGTRDFCTLLDYCNMIREGKPLTEEYTRHPYPGLEKIYDWEAPEINKK